MSLPATPPVFGVRAGDELVIFFNGDIEAESGRRIQETLESRLPGVRVTVVGSAASVGIYRKADQ